MEDELGPLFSHSRPCYDKVATILCKAVSDEVRSSDPNPELKLSSSPLLAPYGGGCLFRQERNTGIRVQNRPSKNTALPEQGLYMVWRPRALRRF